MLPIVPNLQENISSFVRFGVEEIRKIEENLQDAKKYVINASALETLNKRIREIDERISDLNRKIDENYTTSLFDENWILVHFEPFHQEFTKKVSLHSKMRLPQHVNKSSTLCQCYGNRGLHTGAT